MASADEVRALNLDEHDRIRDALVAARRTARAQGDAQAHPPRLQDPPRVFGSPRLLAMSARPPERVAVLGAGTMGSGIALCFARAGSAVTLASRRAATLDAARVRIDQPRAARNRRACSSQCGGDHLALQTLTSSGRTRRRARHRVGRRRSGRQARGAGARRARGAIRAVIATDTSSIPIDELAAALSRPERSPACTGSTRPSSCRWWRWSPERAPSRGCRAAGRLGRRARQASRACPARHGGFIANRIQYAVFREAFALVEAGVCDYADVDEAIKAGLGARWAAVGPFESLDLAGLDVYQAVASRLYPVLATDSEPARLRDLVAAESRLQDRAWALRRL